MTVSVPDRLLLSSEELASMLSISRATLWRMLAAGKLPLPLRPTAGIVRWRSDEIQRWVDSGMPDQITWQALQASSQRNGQKLVNQH